MMRSSGAEGVSPVCTGIEILLSVTQSAIMRTAVMAVATANFVDTAADS